MAICSFFIIWAKYLTVASKSSSNSFWIIHYRKRFFSPNQLYLESLCWEKLGSCSLLARICLVTQALYVNFLSSISSQPNDKQRCVCVPNSKADLLPNCQEVFGWCLSFLETSLSLLEQIYILYYSLFGVQTNTWHTVLQYTGTELTNGGYK